LENGMVSQIADETMEDQNELELLRERWTSNTTG
jgi:hypothetical protein